MPGFAALQDDLEVEPTIGISCFGSTLRRSHHHGANEIAIAIAGSQLLPSLRPLRDDVPAAHDVIRLDLEYVGEIATQHDLKLKVHPLRAVVRNIKVLVHSPADQPTDNETKCAWRNDTIRGENPPIREVDSRGIVRNRTSIEKFPRLAVRINCPTADDARIKEIKTLLARRLNLPIWLAHKDRLAVMN